MSYIDNALIKAQKERDGKDKRYAPVMPVVPSTDTHRRRRWGISAAVIVVAVLCVTLSLFVLRDRSLFENRNGAAVADRQDAASPQKRLPPSLAGTTAVARQDSTIPHRYNKPGTNPIHRAPSGETVNTTETGERRQKDTTGIDSLYQRAMAYQQKGETGRAETAYNQILRREPGHLFSLNNLGVIYLLRGNSDAAAAVFQRAIKSKADYVDPYYNLACLHAREGNTVRALDYLEQAIRLNNDVKNWAKDDRDLSSLRGSDRYARVMGEDPASTQTDRPIYIVREGDRIYDIIGRQFGSSGSEAYRILKRIKQLNPTMEDSNMIYPGRRLTLPGNKEVGRAFPPR